MEAWANTNQPDGNPINETEISRLVRGLSLVYEAIPPSTRTQVERWLSRMASLQMERRPQWEIDRPNNWYPLSAHHARWTFALFACKVSPISSRKV